MTRACPDPDVSEEEWEFLREEYRDEGFDGGEEGEDEE